MTVLCSQCGAAYNPSLFQFGIPFRCECGALVDSTHKISASLGSASDGRVILYVRTPDEHDPESAERLKNAARQALLTEERNLGEVRHLADRIAYLITATDYPKVDIEIEKKKARRRVEKLFPDRVYLFDLIFESRFRRLWDQFRGRKKKGS
jgi:hypothetical protein